MTLPCCYISPRYTLVRLGAVYLRLAGESLPSPVLPGGRDLLQRLGATSLGFLVIVHVYLGCFGTF